MTKRRQISRRAVLRGMGTVMALPLLEAMEPAAAFAARAAGRAPTPPRRMAFLFVPNGAHLPNWTPKTEGYGFELPMILETLEHVKDDLLVLTGLTHDKGRANGDGGGDHARGASAFLTGAQPRKTSSKDIRVGISVDQFAAQRIGDATRFASLELGCGENSNLEDPGSCDTGYSCAYSQHISWSSPTTPVAKETNPRAAFERLFAGQMPGEVEATRRRNARRKSILDFVREDAQRLHAALGRSDRGKLDEYLTGVRSIEKRLVRVDGQSLGGLDLDTLEKPRSISLKDRKDYDYEEHLRLTCDMLVLAFQADLTRVATCMFANAGNNRNYRDIGVPDGHHDLSHHGNDPAKLNKISQINRFHVKQLAYLLERLKSIGEGDGTLLDNCMIVYGSGLSDGNRHNNEDLPILLAGRGGGTLRTGRHVRYEFETPMTNLFLSMLDRIGAPTDSFGDSTGRLPHLSG